MEERKMPHNLILENKKKLTVTQVADVDTFDEGKIVLFTAEDTLVIEGYDLQIVIYDDYILPNTALEDGDLDANYFQHTPYLNSFNESNGTDLVSAGLIHYEPFGIYSYSALLTDQCRAF